MSLAAGQVILATACVIVGLAALWFLVKQRRWWPTCFMACAYGAALYIIYATLLAPLSSAATPLLPLATVTCAYALLLVIVSVSTQSPSLRDRTVLSAGVGAFALLLLFIASASLAHFGHRAFVAFGAALTGGVLLSSTIIGNVLLTRRSFAKFSGTASTPSISMGAQAQAHLFYYGSILSMLVQAISCQDEQSVLSTLLFSVICTGVGTAGVIYQTDAQRVAGRPF